MSTATSDPPRLVRSLPGRARIHVPSWSQGSAPAFEKRVRSLQGVRAASANALTRNLLVHFDREVTDEGAILGALKRLTAKLAKDDNDAPETERRTARPINETQTTRGRRARIALRGLEQDPDLGRRVSERLDSHPDVVLTQVSLLTGRVLVELADDTEIDFSDVVAVLSELEPALEDGDEPPAHPLDPAPLIEGSAKLIGAALGLGLLAVRRVAGGRGAPVSGRGPAEAAAAVGIIEGIPDLSERIERSLGHEQKEVLLGAVAVASLTFSGGTLGLALAAASAARLLTETLAKRAAWREYEERVADGPGIRAGAEIQIQPGGRAPLPCQVLAGAGTAMRPDGALTGVSPGTRLDPGARLHGGPFRVRLEANGSFTPSPRFGPPPASILSSYLRAIGPLSLGYALATGLLTRSVGRAFTALLLVNPRPALYGEDNADRAAAARVIRAGVTVVGSRAGRPIRRPDVLVLDSPRALAEGVERASVIPAGDADAEEVARVATWISVAAGSPWGGAFRPGGPPRASNGSFDGEAATAEVDGERWLLGRARGELPDAAKHRQHAGEHILELRRTGAPRPEGYLALRPRMAPGAESLVDLCRRSGVEIEVLGSDESAAADSLCERAGVPFFRGSVSADHVRRRQAEGKLVAVVSDGAQAAEAFAAADLGIARTSGRHGRFAARTDLLAPGLDAVGAIIEAGVLRDAAARDSVAASVAANLGGAVWGLRGTPTAASGARATQLGALVAIAAGSLRLRGGTRARSVAERLSDPIPERWGREPPESVLRALAASADGLSSEEARERWRPPEETGNGNPLLDAVVEQLRSPLTGFLVAGAGLSLALGATADVFMIAAVIGLNAAVAVWQERKVGSAAEELHHLTARSARVLRDGTEQLVDADELVPGDVIALGSGDRVAADARLIAADRLEVDESALTGESLPVAKAVEGGTDASRVVLEGSDVTMGTARAVVVAVGGGTRMGAMAAALASDQSQANPLDQRLSSILRRGLPVILVGGALVTGAGMLWGQPLLPQLALGASIAIAAVPEGLPLLAGVAEAGVAQRLAGHRAVVSRLTSVEALGRVDIACADKTGTMTEGRPSLELVAGVNGESAPPERAHGPLREVLLAAALASPHPESPDAEAHPTDVAVVAGAERGGLSEAVRQPRVAEEPFDPARGFHAIATRERLYVKGAAEVLIPRCKHATGLTAQADSLAEQGFRVLMVAEGSPNQPPDDPQALTALGFIGIRDPIRANVPAAVRRCHGAGVRVIMLTGDHPSTARAIAREAGLADGDDTVVLGSELAELDELELAERLEGATVVARSTPLDKLRIVEALQSRGHVVAMTGDGVNDAPALRLADVGVAMGEAGTEVARQASDVIVTDDDFSTLVEGLVEGRGFWRNMRQALGLLLGGNLGEVGLMVGAGVAGMAAPMTARQILSVNLVTDVLPAVAIAIQQPEHRNLARLRREGTEALDTSLRGDILRRGVATALPSLAAYALASRSGAPGPARTVAYASVVTTQLSQTVDLAQSDAGLGRSVFGAVAASCGLLAATILVAPMRSFLALSLPTPSGLALIAGATLAAPAVSRALPVGLERAPGG